MDGRTDGQARGTEGGKDTRQKKKKEAQIGSERKKQAGEGRRRRRRMQRAEGRGGEEGEKQTGMEGGDWPGGPSEQEKTSAPGENSDGLSRGRALFTLLVSDSELRLLNNTITAAAHDNTPLPILFVTVRDSRGGVAGGRRRKRSSGWRA